MQLTKCEMTFFMKQIYRSFIYYLVTYDTFAIWVNVQNMLKKKEKKIDF